MRILDQFVKQVLTYRLPQIQHFCRNPWEVQEKTLSRLLSQGKHTEWGKTYAFSEIKDSHSYAKQVPIVAYEDVAPFIQKMMLGQKNILWPGQVNWFSKSSGTTNDRSKFIPVPKESLRTCHFRGGRDILALYIQNNPQTRFFRGRGLSIGGTFQSNPDYPQVRYGDISAVVVQNLPSWAQWIRTPPLSIAMMDAWEEKIAAMLKHTLNRNVTSVLGVPTWTLVLFQRILEHTGKSVMEEVWPNLEVFVHGAVAFTPYRDLFQQLAPSLRFMETYNASEGFFGIQDDIGREDLLLMLDYDIYYEFVPMSELGSDHPQALNLSEVELHKNYAMLITTNGGLWRYKIGDTVKFTSKDPYRIKITGRTKHFINAFGEEVIVENAETAIAEACRQTGAVINNFTAGPLYMGNGKQGGHEWIVEFCTPPADLKYFTQCLDSKLKEINSDYEAKRSQDIALRMPIVHDVPDGTFYNWLKKKGKLGGQHKVPRLANSRDYLEDILKFTDLKVDG